MKRQGWLIPGVLVLGVAGCSGGAGSNTSTLGSGPSSGTVIITLPGHSARPHFSIPSGTASFDVEIVDAQGANLVTPVTVDINAGSVTLQDVPLGPATIKAQAFDGGGHQLSDGADSLTIVAGDNAVTLTLTPSLAAPAGIVHWWPGEQNTTDIVGNTPTTAEGGVSFVTGEVGDAFHFDGINGALDLGNGIVEAQWTVETWVRPLAQPTDTADNQALVFGQSFGSPQLLYDKGTVGVIPAMSVLGSDNAFHVALSPNEIPLNTFTHLAATFDGTNITLFVNGLQVATNALSIGITQATSTDPFNIGGFPAGSGVVNGSPASYNAQQFATADIDEVSYYNRPLSANEILDIFNAGTAGKKL